MTTQLSHDGYEKIEAKIQTIEDLAWDGAFSERNAPSKFQQIVSEAKNLRQILREVFLIVPETAGPDGPKAA